MAEGGALIGELVEQRRRVGLSTVVGQPVFTAVIEALDAVATARGKAIHAHKTLDRMGQALGMSDDGMGYGDGGKDPFTTAMLPAREAAQA
jgi:hypothetical protein